MQSLRPADLPPVAAVYDRRTILPRKICGLAHPPTTAIPLLLLGGPAVRDRRYRIHARLSPYVFFAYFRGSPFLICVNLRNLRTISPVLATP